MAEKTPRRDIKLNIIISLFMLSPVRIHKNVMCHRYKEIHENLTNLARLANMLMSILGLVCCRAGR